MVGTALGVVVVVVVTAAYVREWTPVMAEWTIGICPALGVLTGVAAGVCPASRPASIEPAGALQR